MLNKSKRLPTSTTNFTIIDETYTVKHVHVILIALMAARIVGILFASAR